MPSISSQITTVAPTWSPTSLSPTVVPTLAPTHMPSISPQIITVAPTWSPTSLSPTVAPTSQQIQVPVISFTSDLTISNVQTNYLDVSAQESIVLATANSMNISADFVTFVSSSVSIDVKINVVRLLSFTLTATTKTSIPLQGKYSTFISNPTSLYASLSNTINTAVSNGAFTSYLVAASLKMNSTTTASASIASISISSVIIETNGSTISPTSTPTFYTIGINSPNNTDYYYILLYTFVSFVLFFALIYIIVKCYINYKQRRMRLILSKCMTQFLQRQSRERKQGQRKIQIQRQRQIGGTVNTENIELLIVNN
jgi:hypothetical protein